MKYLAFIIGTLAMISMISSKKGGKTIYFVRHGETNFNTDPVPRVRGRVPVPLNEEGHRHAEQAGEFLKDAKITKIYYSAVNRAKQTAEHIHKFHPEAEFIEEPLVLDISWGDWEGKTYKEAFGDETGGLYLTDPSVLQIPNGESFYSVMDRLRTFLFRVLNSDEDNIVVVSHGTNLNLLGCFAFDAPLKKFWNFYMNGCGVTKLVAYSIDDIRIKYWNANHFLK